MLLTRFLYSVFLSYSLLCLATEPNLNIRQAHSSDEYVYIFAHGLGAYQKQGLDLYARYKDVLNNHDFWILDEPLILFDFPDAKTKEGDYYNKLVNLGQKLDMERLEFVYNETVKQFPGKKIILVGLSRGASVILTLLATKKLDNIAALVLESPFDTLKSIVIHLINRFHMQWVPYARQLGFKIAEKHFPSLDINGVFPMKVISRVPKNIPIIFIHSKKDKVIPINSSRKLYAKLMHAGHKDVYLLELANGCHGKLLANEDYAALYQNAVHAFYKKYNLPHNPQFAQAGQQYLTQPTIQDVMQRITNNRRTLQENNDLADEDEDEEPPLTEPN